MKNNEPRRLLVVDDNHDIADSTALLLAMRGHAVETAYDGGSALEKVQRSDTDTVVLDISMPGISGYEVARRIRALPDGQHIHLIAVTGNSQPHDRSLAHDAGIDDHLVKPVDFETLEDVIASPPAGRDRSH